MKSIQLLYFLLVFSEKSSQFFVIWFGCAKGVKKGDFLCPKRVPKTGQKVASKNPKPKGKLLSVFKFFSFKFSASSFQKTVKRRRVKRTQDSGKQDSNAELAVKDREIKIGNRKADGNQAYVELLHVSKAIVLCSVICHSSRSHLSMSLYCPGNICGQHQCPADGMFPSEAEEYARRAGAAAAAKLVPPRLMCFCSKNSFIYVYLI